MARASAAAARPAPSRAPARRTAPPRRRSGPAAPHRRSPRPAPTAVRHRAALGLARFLEAGTNGLIDRLLRGRLWVGCVGLLLAGIVFLNVSLLQLNQDIARTTTHATALDRQNSGLRARLAALDSSERIQRLAEARGMVMPAPGQYRYLRAHPWLDAELAARRVTAPQPAGTAPPAQPQATAAASAPPAAVPATSTPPAAGASGQSTAPPAAAPTATAQGPPTATTATP